MPLRFGSLSVATSGGDRSHFPVLACFHIMAGVEDESKRRRLKELAELFFKLGVIAFGSDYIPARDETGSH